MTISELGKEPLGKIILYLPPSYYKGNVLHREQKQSFKPPKPGEDENPSRSV